MFKMKRKKSNIVVKGPYLVDQNYRGSERKDATALIVDVTTSRNPATLNKKKISYIMTINPEFWIGHNTIAVFKMKKRQEVVAPGAQ